MPLEVPNQGLEIGKCFCVCHVASAMLLYSGFRLRGKERRFTEVEIALRKTPDLGYGDSELRMRARSTTRTGMRISWTGTDTKSEAPSKSQKEVFPSEQMGEGPPTQGSNFSAQLDGMPRLEAEPEAEPYTQAKRARNPQKTWRFACPPEILTQYVQFLN